MNTGIKLALIKSSLEKSIFEYQWHTHLGIYGAQIYSRIEDAKFSMSFYVHTRKNTQILSAPITMS
jgi:hypothetical protein